MKRRGAARELPPTIEFEQGGSRPWAFTALGLLALIVLAGVGLRFHGLDEVGLWGSDSVYYTSIAKAWTEGERVYRIGSGPYAHRPAVYLAFAAALDLFGFEDDSIKRLNALVDTANLLLIAVLAFVLSGRRWSVALASAAAYATLPMAVRFARVELTHALSTFAVLFSLVTFVLAGRARAHRLRMLLLALCGTGAGLAVLTHEELIYLVAGFGLCLLLGLGQARFPVTGLGRVAEALLLGGLALLTSWGAVSAHSGLLATRSRGRATAVAGEPLGFASGYVERCARFLWDSVLGNGSQLLAALFAVSLVVCLVGAVVHRREEDRGETAVIPAVLILVYVGLHAFFFNHFLVRQFFPFMPLVILVVVLWAGRLWRRFWPAAEPVAHLALVVALALFALGQYAAYSDSLDKGFTQAWRGGELPSKQRLQAGIQELKRSSYQKRWGRLIHESLGEKVGREAKLLVMPSIFRPGAGRRLLQHDFYFGDNAIHLIDYDLPIGKLAHREQVKYVLFTTYQNQPSYETGVSYERYQGRGRWEADALWLEASCRMETGTYSVEREYGCLLRLIERRGGRVLVPTKLEGRSVAPMPKGNGYVLFELP